MKVKILKETHHGRLHFPKTAVKTLPSHHLFFNVEDLEAESAYPLLEYGLSSMTFLYAIKYKIFI